MAKTFTKRVINEAIFALILIVLSRLTEYLQPLIYRKIHPEELWLYKNPRTPSFVSSYNNWVLCTLMSLGVFYTFYLIKRCKQDFIEAVLGASFSGGLVGTITNIIKNIACRPRPDFFYRCFPNGKFIEGMIESCTGDHEVIIEGLKSFPSGHSSLAFAVLGYTSLYLAGKLQCFNNKGRQPWRLVVACVPALTATVVAISRTADYHHHWQDVLVGSCLGMAIAYVSYRQRYPPLNRTTCHLPYVGITPLSIELQDQHTVPTPTTPSADSVLKIM